jgi:ribosomal protein S18 acetylase RimI-like enzyme
MGGAPHERARVAVADDLPRLADLAAEAVDEQRDARGGPLWARREARRHPQASLRSALADPDQRVVVGLLDDTVIGYGVVRIEALGDGGLLAVVDDLYVEPEARGVGVGEALMDELVAFAEDRGCIGIDALALPGNRATKNFFETFGLTARAIVVHRRLGDS